MFDILDADKDGYISAEDLLRDLKRQTGIGKITQLDCIKMIQLADSKNEARVTVAEFLVVMVDLFHVDRRRAEMNKWTVRQVPYWEGWLHYKIPREVDDVGGVVHNALDGGIGEEPNCGQGCGEQCQIM